MSDGLRNGPAPLTMGIKDLAARKRGESPAPAPLGVGKG
jgi:hypothetical protein